MGCLAEGGGDVLVVVMVTVSLELVVVGCC